MLLAARTARHVAGIGRLNATEPPKVVGLQRRWRSHPKGGIYGPTYHHFPTEAKLNWPPKDRSSLMKLPDSKRLMFITNGWTYLNGMLGKRNKKITPMLSFASRSKHNHMDSLTVDEVRAFEKLIPAIKAQFAECKKSAAEEAAKDAQLPHVCR
mmetsp:Transcript_42446/g.68665  ORF Transcript_42446/g.68665 Transcript_42446/m.68665 type:complete len:154 (-) Transcript_42446:51-512(-)|eukprot:CAMPEP_0115101402 /NCGR_PEP_ID=MMETSP0227-20121206/33209_1 /TAXON_ID=89957 /ORGANISM="Polarella glacialis, Strain CCMP 1383" /LENGTH=153 /DNA_ID=CAMNT_0002497143 /DNA_START=31 /DNA_END=492 /DNA_ORIENTATION=-